MHRHMGVRPRPVRHHLRADQQLTAGLQRVVEPLPLGPGVLGAGFLAQRLQHRLHRRGAFRGQVAADDARAAERGRGLHVPVVEPVLVGVGPRGAPLLQRDRGDHPQVIPGGARLSGLDQDLDRLRAQLGRELLRPFGDRQCPRLGDVLGGQGGGHIGVGAQQPHLPHLDLGVPRRHVCHRGQPRRGGTVPVGVMRVSSVKPGQDRGVRGGELRLDLAQRQQHQPARGGIQLRGTRAVEVVQAGVHHPQRIGDAHLATSSRLCRSEPPASQSSAPLLWPKIRIAHVF